ncbi:MAG: pitrilysin family protein [Polyangiaceae bacterium]
MAKPTARTLRLESLNRDATAHGHVEHVETFRFGPVLTGERFRFGNGLELLFIKDDSAPVVAYHTWYRVGSRHEVRGKTGLAHLFEHLMFKETEHLGPGEFDRRLEAAGAESNAGTWLDWTHYHVAIPKSHLGLVIELEAERMAHLIVRDPQVESEKEVVANERRYRVDDDVESTASELLWATAFTTHAYHSPTIGWMQDIEGFNTADCVAFYRTFYAPNNATVIVVGSASEATLLKQMQSAYGSIAPSELPVEDSRPEPPQTDERRREIRQPTQTEKVLVGYKSPALGDHDHSALTVLSEILFGGRAARAYGSLIRKQELATEVRAFVSQFRDPGLLEIFVSARGEVSAETLLDALDAELIALRRQPVTEDELGRAKARIELGLLAGLETADGKASTLGFYEVVLGRPNAAFERLRAVQQVSQSDVLRVARRYLLESARSVVVVRPSEHAAEAAQ